MRRIVEYFRKLKERHMFNAANCRAKTLAATESKRDAKIAEITDRIKFVNANSIGETTVIFKVDQKTNYDYIGQHFADLGFIVVRKTIEELQEEYMLISWKQ